MLRIVDTIAKAHDLAQHLQDSRRVESVLVVSTLENQQTGDSPEYAALAQKVSDLVDVYVLISGRVSFAFRDHMPDHTDVYNGASRVYAANLDWVHDVSKSRLRFRKNQRTLPVKELVRDCENSLKTGNYRQSQAPVVATERWIVNGVVGDRGLIQNQHQQTASVAPAHILPDVPAEALFASKMQLEGTMVDGEVLIATRPRSAADALAEVTVGDVVLVRLVSVDAEVLVGEVYPGFQICVTYTEASVVQTELTANAIAKVQVTEIGAADDDWLAVLAAPDVECISAPAILPGGPPWLRACQVRRAVVDEPDEVDTVSVDDLAVGEEPRGKDIQDTGEFSVGEHTPASLGHNQGRACENRDSEFAREDPAGVAEPFDGAIHPGSTDQDQEQFQHLLSLVEALFENQQVARQQAELESQDLLESFRQVRSERDELLSDTHERRHADLELRHRYAALMSEVAELKANLARVRAGNEAQSRLVNDERAKNTSLRKKLKQLQKMQERADTPLYLLKRVFSDDIEQFNAEVKYHWQVSTSPSDKELHPLPDEWMLHPDFLPSVDATVQASRVQVIRTVVDVLISRRLDNIDIRPSLKGVGGVPRTRARDGAVWQRVNIQAGSAAACRMHACRDSHGVWTFGNVAVHDSFEPPAG